jgi:hypothetical protein
MEPLWYFLSRALAVLIPLVLIGYAAGLWTGWIKWHTWKKEYSEVERDYHKLHDIHDVARATIPELEARRQALTDDIDLLAGKLGEFQQANESFEAESRRLNENLRAAKRNYEAMEEIWRGKITKAEIRILQLEADLEKAMASASGSSSPRFPEDPDPIKNGQTDVPQTAAGFSLENPPEDEPNRLIPFPAALGEIKEPAAVFPAQQSPPVREAPKKNPRKAANKRRAM